MNPNRSFARFTLRDPRTLVCALTLALSSWTNNTAFANVPAPAHTAAAASAPAGKPWSVRNEIVSEMSELQTSVQTRRDGTKAPQVSVQIQTVIPAQTPAQVETAVREPAQAQQTASAPLSEGAPVPAAAKAKLPTRLPPKIQARTQELAPTPPQTQPQSPTTVAAPAIGLESVEPRALTDSRPAIKPQKLKSLRRLDSPGFEFSEPEDAPLVFDIPVTYNSQVKHWIKYFQTTAASTFRGWLERSTRYVPGIQYELSKAGLPQDLIFMPMIESGFSPSASSPAAAVGLWQFIEETGNRYGLRTEWWLDERRDVNKSTLAAIRYLRDLHRMFGSWYLVAASYNMGENGVRRLVKKYGTNNFWALADMGALSEETKNYVPKIIAAMLIAKAPALYGFRDLRSAMPLQYETFFAPGGTDLSEVAHFMGVSEKYLKELNPELIKGFIPKDVHGHRIRIPKGSLMLMSEYVRGRLGKTVSRN